MTLVIGLKGKDGIVIGADRFERKYRAAELKEFTTKVWEYEFGDRRKIVLGSAGVRQDCVRAISRIKPTKYPSLRESATLEEYLERIVEPGLSEFYRDLLSIRRDERRINYSFVIGSINPDNKPSLATIYPDGSFDIEQTSTMGVGAPFAELILRDTDTRNLNIGMQMLLIGYIIAKVSRVSHDVNGVTYGMDIVRINKEQPKQVRKLTSNEFSQILKLADEIPTSNIIENIKKEDTKKKS